MCVCVQGEAEVRSDGTHMTVKPSQLSVARITVVRGCDLHLPLLVCIQSIMYYRKPPGEGSPFIDDYIATSEQVTL